MWIAAGAATLVAVAALVWAKRGGDANADALKEPIPLVTVMMADMQSVTSTVSFTGALAARYDMPIGAEGEGGRIVEVLAEVGDEVKKGQLLAKLDQSVLRPQVARLEASLEQARAQAALSLAEFHRVQSMEAIGALSVEEIERRRAASVTDAAKVRVAAAELAESSARLVKTDIRTPQSGRVLTRTAEVGQTAGAGAALFRVAGDGEIEMRGWIAERDVAALSVDQAANVYLTGIAPPFKGKVRLLGAVIDPASRQGEIRIALQRDPALRPGAFARGEVMVSQAQRTVLPQTAVLSDARGTYVLLVSEASTVERRPVRIANATPDGIVIAEGLKGNERIVRTAGAFLREGERVKVAPNAT
jgi:RND family efflux transporter MFP subunit